MCNGVFSLKKQWELLEAGREAQTTIPLDWAVSSDRRVIHWTMQCQRCYRIQWSGCGDREGLSQVVFSVHTPHSPPTPARLPRPGRQQHAQPVPRLHPHPVFHLVPYQNRAAPPPSTMLHLHLSTNPPPSPRTPPLPPPTSTPLLPVQSPCPLQRASAIIVTSF